MTYAVSRVSSNSRNYNDMYEEATSRNDEILAPASRWGAFHALFGLGSNELFIVSMGDVEGVHDRLSSLQSVQSCTTTLFEPTVRPEQEIPLTRSGLYVFRWFDLDLEHVDEVAQLSKSAWVHFEDAQDYQAEPQALFRQSDLSAQRGWMLLVTWYDGLNSWQRSRQQHPSAAEKFRRRHQLMHRAIPFATRLIVDG